MKFATIILLLTACYSNAAIVMVTVGNEDLVASGSSIAAGIAISTTVSGEFQDSDNANAIVGTWTLSISTSAVDTGTSYIARATTVDNDGSIRVTNQLLNINAIYNLGINMNTGYDVESIFVDSVASGDFSRPNSVVGVSLDQEATWATTNPTFTGFNWSEDGSATTQTGAQLDGTTIAANTVMSTEDYLKGEKGEGIWGFQVDDISAETYSFDFTYSELGGVQDTSSDSFLLNVTVVEVPEPSTVSLLVGGLSLCLLRRSRS